MNVGWYFQRFVKCQIDSHGIIMVTVNYPLQSKFWRIKSNFQISFVLWLHLNLSICLIDPGNIQICVHLLVKFNCYLSIFIYCCWISAAVICCLILFFYKVCILIAFYFYILLSLALIKVIWSLNNKLLISSRNKLVWCYYEYFIVFENYFVLL